MTGTSNPDPPIYIDDKEVDLRESGSWVDWNNGFRIQSDFTLRTWGRDFNEYEPIITLTNDINSTNTPNYIEMKWMVGDVIKTLPTYSSVNGYNVNVSDSQVADIKNLSVYGHSIPDTIVEGTGDNITLNGTIEAPFKEITIKGDTKQVSYTGKNLLPIAEEKSITTVGVTIKSNGDGSYSIKGTPTASFNAAFPITEVVLPTNAYIHLRNTGTVTYNATCILRQNTTDYGSFAFGTLNRIINKTTQEETHINQIIFYGNDSIIGTNLDITLQPSIELTDTVTDFEPYTGGQPSPNPDYPQDIYVVSGDNTITIEGKNLLNNSKYNDGTYYSYSSGMIEYNQKDNRSAPQISDSETITLQPGTYTIKIFHNTGYSHRIQFLTYSGNTISNKNGDTGTFTLTEETTMFIKPFIGLPNNAVLPFNFNIQIEKGSTASTYEPYQGNTYNIDLPVENLCNGISQNVFLNYMVNQCGIASDNSGLYIPVSGGNYTISTTSTQARYRVACSNGVPPSEGSLGAYNGQNKDNTSSSITIDTTGYAYLIVNATDLTKIQIEKGSKQNTYTPYGTTPIELCKIGDYQDYFGKSDGRNLFDKNVIVNQSIYTGSVGQTISTGTNTNTFRYPIFKKTSDNITISASDTSATMRVLLLDNDNKILSTTVYTTLPQTIDTSSCEYIAIFFDNTTITANDNIQINEGTTALPYEPYGVGKWYLHKEIGKVVLDGSETYRSSTAGGNRRYQTTINNAITTTGRNMIYTNYFTYSLDTNNIGITFMTSGAIYLYPESTITTITDFQTWLSTHNTIVYYVLATPTNIEITYQPLIDQLNALYNATSYNEVTIITSEGADINPILTAKAYQSIGVQLGDHKNLINIPDFNIQYTQAYYQTTNTNFELKPNYIYTLSFNSNVNSESTDIYYSIGYGTSNYETDIATNIQYISQTSGRNSVTFIVPDNVPNDSYLWVKFAQTIILADVDVDISNIQLENGKTLTDYQSPNVYNIYLTSSQKNLFDYNSPLYLINENTTYYDINYGYHVEVAIQDEEAYIGIGINNILNAGDTYTISYSQLGQFDDFKLFKTVKGKQTIIEEIPISNNAFVAPAGVYDLQLAFYVDNTSSTNYIEIWNIQIEANNIITTYEPYISNKATIILDEPLRSNEEYADLICLESPNLLNPETQIAHVLGNTSYYLSQTGATSYIINYINEDNNVISSIDLSSGTFMTPENCVKVQILDITSETVISDKVEIELGILHTIYYPYVGQPSIIRYIDSNGNVQQPVVTPLSSSNITALQSLTSYTPITNVYTNNSVLGELYFDYVNGYSEQQTQNAYVLLRCYNANTMPYVIHSNYIDIPKDTDKIFIWCRRKNNLFDLQIENLGDYSEDGEEIDTDIPEVELVINNGDITSSTILATATATDNIELVTVRFSKDNGETWDEVRAVDGVSTVESYTFTGLIANTEYTIRAEAIDSSGNIGGISTKVTTLSE